MIAAFTSTDSCYRFRLVCRINAPGWLLTMIVFSLTSGVIWHKATSPQQTDVESYSPRAPMCKWGHIGATWLIRLNLCFLRSTVSTIQTANRWVQPFCIAHGRKTLYFTVGVLSSKFPTHVASGPPHDSLGSSVVRVHNPNGISIGLAVFAQMTAECPYTLQLDTPFPLNTAPSHGGSGPHLIHGYLQAHPSSQPKRQGSLVWQTDRQTTLLGR